MTFNEKEIKSEGMKVYREWLEGNTGYSVFMDYYKNTTGHSEESDEYKFIYNSLIDCTLR